MQDIQESRDRRAGILDFAPCLRENIGRVFLGKKDAVDLALTTLLAGGHLLIEDKPGVGKTLLARSIARALDLPFQRIQCTADLLPTDILGSQIYNPKSGELSFREGPIFTSVIVADELNRTPPRTQSALLECMAERQVTVDGETRPLPDPFFVLATQNPLDFTGTYPLPENQLDRFLMRISLGYPDASQELEIAAQEDGHKRLKSLPAMENGAKLGLARTLVEQVQVERELLAYMVALVRSTREHPDVGLGVSPRGTQALHRSCRARAVLMDRDFVVPDDIQALVLPVFGHRMRMRGHGEATGGVLQEILERTSSPD